MRILRQDSLLAAVSAKSSSSGIVFVDGASRGNPGPGAIGVVFQDSKGKVVKSIGERIGITTNNVAEYSALIFALQEAIIMGIKDLQVFTDSELLARQFNGEYKVKDSSLKILFFLVKHLERGFHSIQVSHVVREKNTLADREANRALDQDLFL